MESHPVKKGVDVESDPRQEVPFGWLYKSRSRRVCLDMLVSFFSVDILFLFVVFVMEHRHRTLEVKWNPSLPVCLYVCVCLSCSLVCPPLDHLLILFSFWFVWFQVWFWSQGDN